MLTFSVNDVDIVQMLRVQKTISDNIQYFKKFNGPHWQEAVNKAFMTAVTHVKSEYEVLDPYIKNLARNILKESEKESPWDTVNEDGEVSYPFLQLTTRLDEDKILLDKKEIMNTFKTLYLLYEQDFLKLKLIFRKDDDKFTKGEIVKNEEIKKALDSLRMKYGAINVYSLLYDFFVYLPKYSKKIENATIKVIEMKNKDLDYKTAIADIPLIVDEHGVFYDIDKLTLTMEKNPDTFKWDVITQTSCDVLRIDISPLLDYMYDQVFVPQGVHTKHISWCDDIYKVMTPGGKAYVNLDRNAFINYVKMELIAHLSANRFNSIVAISPDYIYVRPNRMMNYDTIRLVLFTGKMIDLPIDVYIKKRK